MVAFNPRFLECSKCYLPYKMSTTEKLHTLIHDNRLLQWLERKKNEDSRIFFTLYYFFPISLVCQKNQPHDGVLLLCLLLSLFEWVHIFLAWKSGAQSWFKEKKKWRYILCYINVEKFLISFSVIFFSLLKVTEVSINFYWNVLGVLWNAFTPTLPKVPGRMEGLKDIYPSSAFLLHPPSPSRY